VKNTVGILILKNHNPSAVPTDFFSKTRTGKKEEEWQTLFQKELFQFHYRVQHAQRTTWVRK